MREPALVTVAQLSEFDEMIDVRSEGEFAEDHIPGAINCPVLDNDERARVGTIYKQRSPFDAKKDRRGARRAPTSRATCASASTTGRATGARSSTAGAAGSAAARSRTCSPRSAGASAGSTAATGPIAAR